VNIIAVLISAIIELFSTPTLNDNLFIPVATGIVLTIGGVV
jgi:dolichol kinase